GYTRLKTELESLEEQRPHVVEEIRKAAADKDFRENAPLQAAREQQGYLEGRIRELEATLKSAKVVSEQKRERIDAGDCVLLHDLASGDELSVTLVYATEANPALGRISMASPMGKALLGHAQGDIVEVAAPAGQLRYRVAGVNTSQASPATE
ncbi:MAG: GreA/GreB family elongation factor, partial [Chloroflexota bacterium]